MPLTVEQFAERLTSAGLMPEEHARQLINDLRARDSAQDGEALARELVRQKALTRFQAEQIYAGKGRSLTLGNYVILDKLGQGGMGMVLKAKHRRMDRVVALKVMSATAMKSAEAVRRFQREAQAAARLNHPNIVAAFDADEANGTHFLVMEFVAGSDLSQIVKQNGAVSVAQALDYTLQAARGLEHAHQQGLIHRDIKPANLLLDQKGTVKILDMGLARFDDSVGGSSEGAGLTSTGTIMGTVDYMSPEQALDTKHADARSDIYSLGISLYYLLTGRVAFQGDTIMKKLLAHREDPIPSIREFRQDVSPELDAIFQRMVAKKPAQRFQTMTEVIAALQACSDAGTTAPSMIRQPDPTSDESSGDTDFRNFLKGLDQQTSFARSIGGEKTSNAQSARTAGTKTEAIVKAGSTPHQTSTLPWLTVSRRWFGIVIAGIALCCGAMLFWPSTTGQLSLEINENQVLVSIGKTGRSFQGPVKEAISLPVGKHILNVQVGETKFETPEIAIAKGEPVEITVERVGNRLRVMRGTESLVTKELSRSKASGASSNSTPIQDQMSTSPDFALEFNVEPPNQRVEIPLASLDPNAPWTLEGYIQPRNQADHNHALVVLFEGDSWLLNLNHWSMRLVDFELVGQQAIENVIASTELPRGQRVHVASVYDGKLARLFVEGKLIGSGTPKSLPKKIPAKLFLGSRFGGMMDEWRISKVARYETDFTPPQRYQSDAETLALYHFDEGSGRELKDSSGNGHHGKIVGAKWVRVEPAPPLGDYALEFDFNAPSSVKCETLKIGVHEPFTIEGLISVATGQNFAYPLMSPDAPANVLINHNKIWQRHGLDGVIQEGAKTDLVQGRRGHVAWVGTGKELLLFVDGRLIDRHTPAKPFKSDPYAFVMGTRLSGTMDEVRVSKTARYLKDFSPAGWHEPDADTWALYHFDEGGGDVLKDSSGNNHHGKIVGAKWVRVSDAIGGVETATTSGKSLQTADLHVPDGKPADMSKPVKVFILLGSAEMLGSGKITGADMPGTLENAIKKQKLYPFLMDVDGKWTERKDVRSVAVIRKGNGSDDMEVHNNEWLKIKNADIGPEIGIGHILGDAFSDPVLLLKSCNGNRSLGWDLLPPGSKGFEFSDNRVTFTYAGYRESPSRWVKGSAAQKIDWYAGKQYDIDVTLAKKVLTDLGAYYPGASKYEIAGFFFWQGYKDLSDAGHASHYEQNLVQLIRQLRTDFNAPNAPFVCATLGEAVKGSGGNEGKILDAQLAVDGASGKYPQFKGNVATVYTNPLSRGGTSKTGYDGNSQTFIDIGLGMGDAMLKLLRPVTVPTKREVTSDEWIDVLPLIDPALDKSEAARNLIGKNDWRIEQRELWYYGDEKSGKLFFPVRYRGRSLEWELEFTRTKGNFAFNTDIPVPGGFVPIQIGNSGIVLVNEKLSEQFRLVTGQRAKLRFRVTQDGASDRLKIFANDEPIADWKGDLGKIKTVANSNELRNQAEHNGLYIGGLSDYSFHAIRVRMLNGGTAELLRPGSSSTSSSSDAMLTPYQLFTSADYEWSKLENLGPLINTANEEGSPTLSGDGLTLIFESNRPGGQGNMDLWMSRRSSLTEAWSEPENLGSVINTTASEISPALSADGLTLFYASDRTAAPRQYRLWFSTRKTPTSPWLKPTRLFDDTIEPAGVRSAAPTLSRDGLELLFHSNSRQGAENFDLWRSRRKTLADAWGMPEKLSPPINSTANDSNPELSSDGRVLLFASDREAGRSIPLWWCSRPTSEAAWSEPQKIGGPLDSSYQLNSPALSSEGQTLIFLAWDLPEGKGKSDLWMIRRVLQPEAAARLKAANTFTNSLGMEFVRVPKGKSWLGGGGGKPGTREVTFQEDFYLGKFEVTQGEWAKVMNGSRPSYFRLDAQGAELLKSLTDEEVARLPVEAISWDQMQTFLRQLNEQARDTGWVYRLPTANEWEYAARGGPLNDQAASAFDFYFDRPTNELLAPQANFAGTDLKRTCPVGKYPPNPLDLHDLFGNVREWCQDEEQHPGDKTWRRVVRGGGWNIQPDICRAARHDSAKPGEKLNNLGFRVARVRAAMHAAWQPLFNGKDLTGWIGDPKRFSVVNDELKPIGGAKGGPSSAWLDTQREFGDFTLKAQAWVGGNSGIRLRSAMTSVTAEVTPGKDNGRTWAMGRFDTPDTRSQVPTGNSFRPSDWNDLELTRQGTTVSLRINGEAFNAADPKSLPLLAQLTGPVVIGLESNGGSIGFRDIRIQEHSPAPEVSWQPLFNGKDLTGLKQRAADGIADVVVEGQPFLRLQNKSNLTTRRFGDYHLRLQCQMEKGARIIVYSVDDSRLTVNLEGDLSKANLHAVEMTFEPATIQNDRFLGSGQVIDIQKVPYSDPRARLLFAKVTLNADSPWQTLEIIRLGDSCAVLLNGQLAAAATNIRITRNGEPPKIPATTELGFTAYGGTASYRNIEIRDITSLPPELLK